MNLYRIWCPASGDRCYFTFAAENAESAVAQYAEQGEVQEDWSYGPVYCRLENSEDLMMFDMGAKEVVTYSPKKLGAPEEVYKVYIPNMARKCSTECRYIKSPSWEAAVLAFLEAVTFPSDWHHTGYTVLAANHGTNAITKQYHVTTTGSKPVIKLERSWR